MSIGFFIEKRYGQVNKVKTNRKEGVRCMTKLLYLFYAVLYLLLFAWCIRLCIKNTWWNLSNVIILIIISLIYDNAIIAIGEWIGVGSLLQSFNTARYWLHAFFTPLLILYGLKTLINANIAWTKG